jgi:DNA-binding transcriptional MocR family regulator
MASDRAPTLARVETISLARGVPDSVLLPSAELAACAQTVLEREPAAALSYGPPSGHAGLRATLAAQHEVDPGRVLITNGSLQGLAFLLTHVLTTSDHTMLVESPTYDRMLKLLDHLGAKVVRLPVDEHGLDVDALEEAMALATGRALLYTIPTFQNPTGTTLSLARRLRLAELARVHGLLVVEDDPYALVRFEGEPLPSLFELLEGEGVVYASSFSKTIAPGLRVGYVVVPDELAGPLESLAASTYVSPVVLTQAIVAEFLGRGLLDGSLERIRSGLLTRRDALLAALGEHLPEAAWTRPEGGYFLWLDLPRALDATELLQRSAARGVTFVRGADFGGPAWSARLAFSAVPPGDVYSGLVRLAEVARSLPRRRLRAA